ncbi:MAG: hypothetical protein VYB07_08150 [Actinomycetota bacterium]|nr:hypothetical protein [Actinomycetota bacterium]|tara:strand:- start:171 stop:1283 length:1113 start_codon:yes stop_codon:yes gene_type:complete
MNATTEVNNYLKAINPISAHLMAERTGYSSQLIPVTSYVTVSAIEAFLRYPEVIGVITQSMEPEEIGTLARRPACQANSVFLWGVANFWLLGRNIMSLIDPSLDDVSSAYKVLDFWGRVSRSYRGGDFLHSADNGNRIDVLKPSQLDSLMQSASPVDDDRKALIRNLNATLINYLFLLYFDTRVGHGDTGPYKLEDGRTIIVRDYYRLSKSDFWWSEVAAELPYENLTAIFVLDPTVEVTVTDFGTSVTTPEDYLNNLESFAIFASKNGHLEPIDDDQFENFVSEIKQVQKIHYRNIVAMDRDERIKCGAYVYFTFLRPFAQIAGVEKEIDWECPRDIPKDIYPLVTAEVEPPQQDPNSDPYPYYEEINK